MKQSYTANSLDFVAYEDLQIKNMAKNHCLAKSINDAGWYQFRVWLEHNGRKFGRVTVAVPPRYTSQMCSSCGVVVKKSLSTRTHICKCGCVLDRDENAALNILKLGLGTVGHTGTFASEFAGGSFPLQHRALDARNALGRWSLYYCGCKLCNSKPCRENLESPLLQHGECQLNCVGHENPFECESLLAQQSFSQTSHPGQNRVT